MLPAICASLVVRGVGPSSRAACAVHGLRPGGRTRNAQRMGRGQCSTVGTSSRARKHHAPSLQQTPLWASPWSPPSPHPECSQPHSRVCPGRWGQGAPGFRLELSCLVDC